MGPLITIFGCGYVGSALAQEALKRGWRVRALTRNEDKARLLEGLGAEVLVADLADRNWHRKWEERGDYLVNTVSAASRSLDGYRHSYLEGMKSVVAWTAAGTTSAQLVYTGSTSVYPQTDGAEVGETDTGFEADGLRPTAEVLLEAEALLQEPLPGIRRAFILRLAGIYGPGRHYLLDQLRAGERVFAGSGEFLLNLIHRDDAVAAILAAFAAPGDFCERIFNISDGNPVLKRELVEWLASRLGAETPSFDPMQETLRQRQRKTASGALPHRHILNRRALNRLEWRPVYRDFKSGYQAILQG